MKRVTHILSVVITCLAFFCSASVANEDPLAQFIDKITKELEKQRQQQEAAEKRRLEEEKRKAAEQQLIKELFGYTFNDISQHLVIIKHERGAGSGFVGQIDGKRYILTNQHVILGAKKLSFTTIQGERLHPTRIELAASRDLARLLIEDGEGLDISGTIAMDVPVAVFGNSEGSGVATELYGRTTGIGAEVVEVTAEFVKGNSGSPVLGLDGKVIGIASYLRYLPPRTDTEGTRFDGQIRRFCYRVNNAAWQPVNWKKFNAQYGAAFAESNQFVQDLMMILSGMNNLPPQIMNMSAHSDTALEKWAGEYNKTLKDYGKNRRRFYLKYASSMESLSDVCDKQAWQIRLKMKPMTFSGFVLTELENHVALLESVASFLKQASDR